MPMGEIVENTEISEEIRRAKELNEYRDKAKRMIRKIEKNPPSKL